LVAVLGGSAFAGAGAAGFEATSGFTGSGLAPFSTDGLAVRCAVLAAAESGRASCAEMIAGSTGAP
jgi:hypothetical protein